jgi:hypothetical protein
LGVIGAGIGAAVSPGNPAAIRWGWAIGTVLGSVLIQPKLQDQERSKVSDLRVSGCSAEASRSVLWRTAVVTKR